MVAQSLKIVGGLINNSYARARRAWTDRNVEGYQNLARLQAESGSDYLDLNLDGTPTVHVRLQEMLAFLPEVIAAIQAVTPVPLCFDNPALDFHRTALEHYDRSKSSAPLMNSLAASREDLDQMIQLVADYDTHVIVMASEQFTDEGSAQCLDAKDSYRAAKTFVERLVTQANRSLDQIFIDPGLAPVAADTYGLVNIGLDTMRLIREDPELEGVHMIVGLSNFAWGTHKDVRPLLERAYLALGVEAGLDCALANPDKDPSPLSPDHPIVAGLRHALAQGTAQNGESQEVAGFRQAAAIMELCKEFGPSDDDDDDDD